MAVGNSTQALSKSPWKYSKTLKRAPAAHLAHFFEICYVHIIIYYMRTYVGQFFVLLPTFLFVLKQQ